MQVNPTTNGSQQYFNALQNKQNQTSTQNFGDQLTSESDSTSSIQTSQTTTNTQAVEEPQKRFHEVFTYANTKGMSNDDIDTYFSERTDEERDQIKYVVSMANNFSDNDAANEAVFNEFKNHPMESANKSMVGTDFFTDKYNFFQGSPKLSNVLVASDDTNEIIGKPAYGSQQSIILNVKFTSKQASNFLSTMTQLAKNKMDEARGTQVYDDYKEVYDRYNRMNDNYNDLLAKTDENTKVNIHA